ncbi:insulin-related peptide 4-like isoform X3 [Pectinophora gossypiella]|uniref:insulin-related peptide 4-like isoform X3 n=1 Tax=Pectinophora gossypiella TaxID=13191 RepID=UPI00214F295B|nr:insulin-related peptide 4-like isoform X3 [Pectinophora gossypiella]
MLVKTAVQVAMLAAAVLCGARTEAATSSFKLCGRELGEIMKRVCRVYNSPQWDVPTVVEQPATVVRRKRGIADECCTDGGCTWEQLSEYCSVSANSDVLLEDTHMIADRSAEVESGAVVAAPAVVSEPRAEPDAGKAASARREVGRRSSGTW